MVGEARKFWYNGEIYAWNKVCVVGVQDMGMGDELDDWRKGYKKDFRIERI